MLRRPRRNRKNAAIREMVAETSIGPSDLILPLFLIEGTGIKQEIDSMPGIYRFSTDQLLKEVEACLNLGINTFALFPSIDDSLKDKTASESLNPDVLPNNAVTSSSDMSPTSTPAELDKDTT